MYYTNNWKKNYEKNVVSVNLFIGLNKPIRLQHTIFFFILKKCLV